MSISVSYTKVGVNLGDHAQDVINMIEVGPDETVESLVRRTIESRATWSESPYADYLTIRIVKPFSIEEGEF